MLCPRQRQEASRPVAADSLTSVRVTHPAGPSGAPGWQPTSFSGEGDLRTKWFSEVAPNVTANKMIILEKEQSLLFTTNPYIGHPLPNDGLCAIDL